MESRFSVCVLGSLLVIALPLSLFAFSKGDDLQYASVEASYCIFPGDSIFYKEVIHIDSVINNAEDTNYYYTRYLVETEDHNPNGHDTVMNDTISKTKGDFQIGKTSFAEREDTLLLFRIKNNPGIGDTLWFFSDGTGHVIDTIVLTKTVTPRVNGRLLQAFEGSYSVYGPSCTHSVSSTTAIFTEQYGLCCISFYNMAWADAACGGTYAKTLVSLNNSPVTAIAQPLQQKPVVRQKSILKRFNSKYGVYFCTKQGLYSARGAKIMDIDGERR